MKTTATVETYRLYTIGGRYIRMATRVTLENGRVVEFLDRIPSKSEAIRQARLASG